MKGNTESLRGGVGMGILHRLRGTPGKAAVPGFLLLCLAISTAFSTPPVSLDSLPTLVMFTPVSVDSDPRDHTLWVADQYLPRIAHIEGDGAPISVFAASRYGGGRPAGVALEPVGTGHLFISDPDLLRIVRVDPSGNPAGAFGTSGLGIDNPADLAWDSRDGSLYVADPSAREVFHLRPLDTDGDGAPDSASLLDSFSTVPLGSDNPMGVALDPLSSHLFLSDPALDRVFELTAAGAQVNSFDTGFYGGTSVTGLGWENSSSWLKLADAGRKLLTLSSTGAPVDLRGTAPFGTLSPQGIAWDPASATLVVVSGERKMIRFQPDAPDASGTVQGTYLHRQEWTSSFGSIAPVGIALDSGGADRYVLDSLLDRAFRVDSKGAVIASFETAPAGSTSPTGIAQGPAGTGFYISDSAARKVFQISATGALLGSFSTSPFKHEPQGEPLCNDPQGIAYDASRDHFFVVDYQAARVFEITRSGYFVASFPTSPAAAYPTDVTVDPAGDRVIISDSSGSYAEFTRSGVFSVKYPGVPVRIRLSGAEGVSVEPTTLQRLIYDPLQDAVFFLSKSGAVLSQISLEPYGLRSPSGAAWLASESRLYVLDGTGQRLYSLTAGPDGSFGNADDTSASISTVSLGSASPKGIALNRGTGKVGWVDEANARLTWVSLALVYLGSVDLAPAGATAPRGVDQDPTSADLFASDPASGLILSGPSGNPIQITPWSNLGVSDPGGLGLSPAEGLLLVVDRAARNLISVDMQTYFLPEVTGLEYLSDSEISWNTDPVFASYQVYRGDLQDLVSGSYGGCFWSGPSPPAVEVAIPVEGSGWFYLAAGKNPTGLGNLGSQSDGTPRPPGAVYPACP